MFLTAGVSKTWCNGKRADQKSGHPDSNIEQLWFSVFTPLWISASSPTPRIWASEMKRKVSKRPLPALKTSQLLYSPCRAPKVGRARHGPASLAAEGPHKPSEGPLARISVWLTRRWTRQWKGTPSVPDTLTWACSATGSRPARARPGTDSRRPSLRRTSLPSYSHLLHKTQPSFSSQLRAAGDASASPRPQSPAVMRALPGGFRKSRQTLSGSVTLAST